MGGTMDDKHFHSRSCGDGFTITLDYEDDKAVVGIVNYVSGEPVDVIETTRENGHDVFTHPAFYSDAYATALAPMRNSFVGYDPDLRVAGRKKKKSA
jgi:hypothetical protein